MEDAREDVLLAEEVNGPIPRPVAPRARLGRGALVSCVPNADRSDAWSARETGGRGRRKGGERTGTEDAMLRRTMGWPEATDEGLIAGLVARDEAAVEVLVQRYWARAHRVAAHMTGDLAAAEDVAQEALVRALQGARRFERGGAFAPWFFAIVKNAARDHLRRSERRAAHEARVRPAEAAPAAALERDEEAAAVRAGLAGLGPEQREVLALHYLEGLTFADVARALGCPQDRRLAPAGPGRPAAQFRAAVRRRRGRVSRALSLRLGAPPPPAAIEPWRAPTRRRSPCRRRPRRRSSVPRAVRARSRWRAALAGRRGWAAAGGLRRCCV
ncbi:MAG: sigma-70 family RNA polymerase sigma factor [Planctomycetes bacterium]|nr:sigma-70 family RNA polymerase sigma factor [Planctomycetota bacterium]